LTYANNLLKQAGFKITFEAAPSQIRTVSDLTNLFQNAVGNAVVLTPLSFAYQAAQQGILGDFYDQGVAYAPGYMDQMASLYNKPDSLV